MTVTYVVAALLRLLTATLKDIQSLLPAIKIL